MRRSQSKETLTVISDKDHSTQGMVEELGDGVQCIQWNEDGKITEAENN